MKIIAPCSRESSLHAVVRAGFPIGTNSKPGGGSRFSVNCARLVPRSASQRVSRYLKLELLLLVLVFDKLEPGLVFGADPRPLRSCYQACGHGRCPVHQIALAVPFVPLLGVGPAGHGWNISLLPSHLGRQSSVHHGGMCASACGYQEVKSDEIKWQARRQYRVGLLRYVGMRSLLDQDIRGLLSGEEREEMKCMPSRRTDDGNETAGQEREEGEKGNAGDRVPVDRQENNLQISHTKRRQGTDPALRCRRVYVMESSHSGRVQI